MIDRTQLKAFVDGELPEAEMQAMRQAIASDPALQQEVDTMRLLGLEIRKAATQPDPIGMEATLDAVNRPKLGWFARPQRLAWAAGGLVVLFLLLTNLPKMAGQNESVASEAKSMASFSREMPAASQTPAEGGFGKAEMADKAAFAEETQSRSRGGADGFAVADNRMIIRNGDIRVKVEDAEKAVDDCKAYVASIGGFVQSSRVSIMQGSVPVGNMVIRVPERRFDDSMKTLRSYGERISENTGGDDVTLQHADVTARLKVMRAEEEQYVVLMGQAKTIGQVMEVKARLSQVRQQIESLDAQRKALENQSALSTINVTFEQRVAVGKPEAEKGWAAEAWANAVNGLAGVAKAFASAVIFLFVYAPIWIPIVLLVWWISRKLK